MGLQTVDLRGSEWRSFVVDRDDSTAFHEPAWAEALSETYGFPVFGVVRTVGGVAHAGLAVAEISRFYRRRWVALPFSDHCAALGDEADRRALLDELAATRERLGLERIEVRGEVVGSSAVRRPSGVLHRLALAKDEDEMMNSLRRTQVGRNIVRAQRDGVEVVVDRSFKGVDAFYNLHLLTRRRLGVPVQPRRFFRALHERVIGPGLGFVLVARHMTRPVAAAIVLDHKHTLTYKFGASDPNARRVRPNHAVFWSMIAWGISNGRKILDMGRSDVENTGLRQFKSSWGASESPLQYSFLGVAPRRAAGPERLLGPIIRRTPPTVCRVIGETLYRYTA